MDSRNSDYDPQLAAALEDRIFVPAEQFLPTLLPLPADWRTNTTVRGQIDAIRRDSIFQLISNEYLGASSSRLYDSMRLRVLDLTSGAKMSVRPHFLEYAIRDEWLDDARGAKYRLLPKEAPRPTEGDAQDKDQDRKEDAADDITMEEEEADTYCDDLYERRKMMFQCGEKAMTVLARLSSHSLGLLLSPKKAQPLYYDRSAIVICEALNIVDKQGQLTDIFIAMLIGFSAVPERSGIPSFLSAE
ncbi:uncharacterized protein BT62DRAFT_932528 [Guyanagaster necrorhizus]|uniref:Uncharacterized protein n=1 Tax=Guyanagaster necrorhizus TaxID=856835 RepID=A0A9P8AS94_9AGAR|nr:uncharacterized protein BT62DRAFT_932528 [Guyanagaster necrorhizus MCA 3950]KAG7446163.1 hypothetical protein BT62DRAFT_932528 [Guyanagaster necrorhizus MCA 3950]